ncbi:ATP-binding protein [Candidatus Sumerlaeota bacterium]|nr:ATP-binding protein [Candidatus Sumerlaeota bacterium]
MSLPRPFILELRCPVEMSILSWIRGVIAQTAAALGLPEEDLSKIEMSVDEACANVIEHAYPDPPEEALPLTVRVEAMTDALRIMVCDSGVGAGDLRGAVKSIEEYVEVKRYRGLGTHIMQRFMDEVEFVQSPGEGTRVCMVKYLTPPNATVGSA